jgi:hypothetical protein
VLRAIHLLLLLGDAHPTLALTLGAVGVETSQHAGSRCSHQIDASLRATCHWLSPAASSRMRNLAGCCTPRLVGV